MHFNSINVYIDVTLGIENIDFLRDFMNKNITIYDNKRKKDKK
jgi:hypothetical protein